MHTLPPLRAAGGLPALDWDDLRFVHAALQHGSLLAAARSLGVDHTTVGRRLEAAEACLGVTLFVRGPGGLTLTPDGLRLEGPLQQLEAAAVAVARAAVAADTRLAGPITLTAPETFGVAFLAPLVGRFVDAHPAVSVAIEPSGAVLDLARQEAQVAVRTVRTSGAGVVTRRLTSVAYGLYAAASYLERRGPVTSATIATHTILAPSSLQEPERRWWSQVAPDVQPNVCSDVSLALAAAAEAGAGLAVLPRYLGVASRTLRAVHVDGAPPLPRQVLYLAVHADLRRTPRVRALMDFLLGAIADADARLGDTTEPATKHAEARPRKRRPPTP